MFLFIEKRSEKPSLCHQLTAMADEQFTISRLKEQNAVIEKTDGIREEVSIGCAERDPTPVGKQKSEEAIEENEMSTRNKSGSSRTTKTSRRFSI